MGKLLLELPVGVGMGLDGGAARPNRGVAAALPVRHDLVGGRVVAVEDHALDLVQPLARAVILQDARSRAVGDQDPGAGGFHGDAPLVLLVLSVAIRYDGTGGRSALSQIKTRRLRQPSPTERDAARVAQ